MSRDPVQRSGLIAEIGECDPRRAPGRPRRAARPGLTRDPWASTNPGVAHACGHDVHTAGAGRRRPTPSPRPTGAGSSPAGSGCCSSPPRRSCPAARCLPDQPRGARRGRADLRAALRPAARRRDGRRPHRRDHQRRRPDRGPARGHRRPHLAAPPHRGPDLRPRQDHHRAARGGVAGGWTRAPASASSGACSARGPPPTSSPTSGIAAGTVRMLDPSRGRGSRPGREALIDDRRARTASPRRSTTSRASRPWSTTRPAPGSSTRPSTRCSAATGAGAPQSLGGEDFGWYLERVPGAMFRLGTRTPGGPTYDLHQGDLASTSRRTAVGARVLAEVAVTAMSA